MTLSSQITSVGQERKKSNTLIASKNNWYLRPQQWKIYYRWVVEFSVLNYQLFHLDSVTTFFLILLFIQLTMTFCVHFTLIIIISQTFYNTLKQKWWAVLFQTFLQRNTRYQRTEIKSSHLALGDTHENWGYKITNLKFCFLNRKSRSATLCLLSPTDLSRQLYSNFLRESFFFFNSSVYALYLVSDATPWACVREKTAMPLHTLI